ncbi:unnamed protein product [Cunninghamella echinulata]
MTKRYWSLHNRASAAKGYAQKRAFESGGFVSKNQQLVIEGEEELINFEYDELIVEEEINEALINVNPKFEKKIYLDKRH